LRKQRLEEICSDPAEDRYVAPRRKTPKLEETVKVIASSLRKGNIVEIDGKLGVIVSTENIHPGKGTPVTQMDVRRIADGVKLSLRFKTTEQVERAFVEDRKHQFMYQDSDGFHFMNMESYDQVAVPADIVGDLAAYLQPEMEVTLSLHEDVPVAIELPPRATLEVVETEPAIKSQTAASSYKPAVLSNGVRTMVPPFVTTGTRIVVMTADGSYVERAKN
jgi:elongation factor P